LLSDHSGAGDARELLFGPVSYGLGIAGVTLLYFRPGESVIPAVPAIVTLCVGDGLAETFGQTLGSWPVLGAKWPWSARKTLVGSIGGFLLAAVPAVSGVVRVIGTEADRLILWPAYVTLLIPVMFVESLGNYLEAENLVLIVATVLTWKLLW
jgi:dolichol kinase